MQRYISIFGRSLVREVLCNNNWYGVAWNLVPNSTLLKQANIRYYSGTKSTPLVEPIGNYRNQKNAYVRKKFKINDLINHINNGKEFYLKQLINIFHTIEFDKLTSDEAVMLLKYCGATVPDSSRTQRNVVCQDIFKGLQESGNLNTEIFNRYIKTCTENGTLIYSKDLLLIKCEFNKETYKLLLDNVCQFGKINYAFDILEIIKNKGIPLDNDSLNSLTLAQTLNGGLKGGEEVMNTIKTAQISDSLNAKFAIFIGLIRRKNLTDFKKASAIYSFTLNEEQFLYFIEELGLNSLEYWLDEEPHFYKNISITRELQAKIEKISIHLVHMNREISAMNIYKKLIEPHPNELYGARILKEMLHCDIEIATIITITNSLVDNELNHYILEYLTEAALIFKYQEKAWALLQNLKIVRPHYFWPLLIQYGKNYGENGVFDALKRVKTFNVKVDTETLEYYVLPYCDLSNINLLMLKLQDFGFTVREIVNSLLVVLLKLKKAKKASDLCRQFNVVIAGKDFTKLLAKSWASTKDTKSILTILARYCESNGLEQDAVGIFLIHTANMNTPNDVKNFLFLIQSIKNQRLRLSVNSAEIIKDSCKSFASNDFLKDLTMAINSLVDFGLNITEDTAITHPKNLDLDGLECHLIELQAKNMETRGVLRKLIQMHAGKGNVQRTNELRKLFLDSGYEESPGIKSSIMHNYVLGGQLDEAMELYSELKTNYSLFQMDSFKFIDLVKLLIDNDRFDEGFDILQKEVRNSKSVINTRSIERNCRQLLSACKNADQLDMLFTLMTESGLCKISNVMLGPLIRIHLKNGDIDKAVTKYIDLSKKHKCTPLQVEVLRAVAKLENSDQLEKVLKATEAVHGPIATQVGLLAALAENGQENALRKALIINYSSNIQGLLHNRCKRWVEERKIKPLKCLANASIRLPKNFVDFDFIFKCIWNVYDLNNDCEEALLFFDSIPEELKSIQLDLQLQQLREKNKFKPILVNKNV